MKKPHLVIDVALCQGCNNCFLACKDEHAGNDWPGYAKSQSPLGERWIEIPYRERGQYPLIDVTYRPTMCTHCADAPCVPRSDGAIGKRADGIVLIDPEKAAGREELVKVVHKQAEEGHVSLRSIRRDANERVKQVEKEKTITEDESFKTQTDIQKLTDRYIQLIDQAKSAKEKELTQN